MASTLGEGVTNNSLFFAVTDMRQLVSQTTTSFSLACSDALGKTSHWVIHSKTTTALACLTIEFLVNGN